MHDPFTDHFSQHLVLMSLSIALPHSSIMILFDLSRALIIIGNTCVYLQVDAYWLQSERPVGPVGVTLPSVCLSVTTVLTHQLINHLFQLSSPCNSVGKCLHDIQSLIHV